jgi:hypothetical protein
VKQLHSENVRPYLIKASAKRSKSMKKNKSSLAWLSPVRNSLGRQEYLTECGRFRIEQYAVAEFTLFDRVMQRVVACRSNSNNRFSKLPDAKAVASEIVSRRSSIPAR